MELRLDKFLADMGRGTRTEVKNMIRKGRVTINGVTEKKPEKKVRIPEDTVNLDGTAVCYAQKEYYLLNKPAGVVSATEDKRYPTVLSLIREESRRDLFPVGRLDLDTEGLLLLTNDGALAHRLLAPKHHVDKVYYAVCAGRVPKEAIESFQQGLRLSDGLTCLPAELRILGYERAEEERAESGRDADVGNLVDGEKNTVIGANPGEEWESTAKTGGNHPEITKIELVLREGKFHQVKRMMEEFGCPVLYLKRLSMGPLTLDASLGPGEYRKLTKKERELLETL